MRTVHPLARLNLGSFWRRRVRLWGYEVSADSMDRLAYLQFHRLGWMGCDEKKFLEETVRPGMRVVDVGANLGLYTLLLSRLVGESGTVVALEPDPQLFETLKANCLSNGAHNVEIHNLAAGSSSARMLLARSLINAGDNRLAPNSTSALTRPVEVQVTTVDAIISKRPVDFVKVDVQGWESHVLSGMREVFRANAGIQVYFEYWPYGLNKAGCEPSSLLRQFDDLGFRLFEVSGGRHVAIADLQGWNGPRGSRYTNLYAVRRAQSESQAAC